MPERIINDDIFAARKTYLKTYLTVKQNNTKEKHTY